MRLTLKPIGPVEPDALEHLRKTVQGFDEVAVAAAAPLPDDGYDARRKQRLASSLFPLLLAEPGARVLGVTDADLYETGLNFVFGYSQPNGRVAVISLARLHDADHGRFLERAAKEAVHELGHTLGLGHDEGHPRCVMRFSRTLADTDLKSVTYCPDCAARAAIILKRLRT